MDFQRPVAGDASGFLIDRLRRIRPRAATATGDGAGGTAGWMPLDTSAEPRVSG
jgi:hypothetical protein